MCTQAPTARRHRTDHTRPSWRGGCSCTGLGLRLGGVEQDYGGGDCGRRRCAQQARHCRRALPAPPELGRRDGPFVSPLAWSRHRGVRRKSRWRASRRLTRELAEPACSVRHSQSLGQRRTRPGTQTAAPCLGALPWPERWVAATQAFSEQTESRRPCRERGCCLPGASVARRGVWCRGAGGCAQRCDSWCGAEIRGALGRGQVAAVKRVRPLRPYVVIV